MNLLWVFLSRGGSVMNKQYKVIWSKVKNTYVVVSELAKRNGKSESGIQLD